MNILERNGREADSEGGAIPSALARLGAGGFSVGIEAPLDNDWTHAGELARRLAGRLPGEPDLRRHAELAQLADRLGFRALWVRDVPVYDPAFGDAAQVFEVFSYLGYLAGITRDILLGTAAVVLPIREPLLTLKSAASVQRLSGNRLLLGVASGDRPVEYPLFGRDFAGRGENFREQVALLREGAPSRLPPGLDVLPRLDAAPPLLVAGLAQQTPEWIGERMDGCLAYPGTPDDHARRVAAWRAVSGAKPYASFIHLDLAERPDEPLQRWRFGLRGGREALAAELRALRAAGVDHVGLHFRRNQRPLAETLHEIAEHVLPLFHTPSPAAIAAAEETCNA
ncbi:TIGR03571 family LLM class oxidoreductase [Achromobacter denitrificans]|uniref:TIGR03571 family LLM class oxidoreductase n=1 Tax=Achromobacter denitrificans TaxID=32002 RepID=UPI003B8A7E8E